MQITHLLTILVSAALAAESSGSTPAIHPRRLGRLPAPIPNGQHIDAPGAETPPSFTFQKLLSLQQKIWDNFIYPANQIEVSQSNKADLLKRCMQKMLGGSQKGQFFPQGRPSRTL